MPDVTNAQVAELLERYGDLLGLAGESPFRVRAYRSAGTAIRALDRPIAAVAAEGALRGIPGVGEGIAAIVTEVVKTGTFRGWNDLTAAYPPSLLDLLQVPGVGAKTVTRLFRDLGIADLDALERAARTGSLRTAPGFGRRVEATVLAGLDALRQRSGRLPIGDALPAARAFSAEMRRALQGRVEIAGGVRRFAETVGDLDFVVEAVEPAAALDAVERLAVVAAVEARTPDSVRLRLQNGLLADVFASSPDRFGAVLVRATGPASHLARLGPLPAEAPDEAAVYAAKGLPWIPPELRLGGPEFERWREIPGLVRADDIRGELHAHSTWSDGAAGISEMAAAASSRGYVYLAVTDHSQSLGVAGGLSPDRLRAQRAEIDHAALPIPVLQGSEVEVARDGTLDFDDDVLAGLDVVVASLHVGLRQPREQLMARLENVLRNPRVDILAHPSGRLIERRPPGDFDWPRIFALAAETGTILEINADPARLDLNRDHAAAALAAGCLLEIACDAHHPDGFANIEFGIAVARQAWASPAQIVNTWELDRLRERLACRG